MSLHLHIHTYLKVHEHTYLTSIYSYYTYFAILSLYFGRIPCYLIYLVQHGFLRVGHTGLGTEGNEQFWNI